ncbi:MAG: hypothetical protein AB1659_10380 [Thermodesulfobacteriota bacterium]
MHPSAFQCIGLKGCCKTGSMKHIHAALLFSIIVFALSAGALYRQTAMPLPDLKEGQTHNSFSPNSGEKDMDSDGIPDRIETEIFISNPKRKTLFVRPSREKEACETPDSEENPCLEYWKEFSSAIFPGSSDGRANIPAFCEANIEVIIVGHPDNPYKPMQKFAYHPASDSNHPPCSIMEITLKKKIGRDGWPVYPVTTEDEPHRGHTFFRSNCPMDESTSRSFWVWSTFGYSSSAEKSNNYYKAFIYAYPLDRYFSEGAYASISVGEKPVVTDCKKYPGKCNMLSPFNFNDSDPPPNPPYLLKPDDTVEFNDIEFDADGTILRIGQRGKPYTREEVLARTVVHEMGHALLESVQEDHCRNPSCILYQFVLDWDPRCFGSSCDPGRKKNSVQCKHGPGGSHDIRAHGIVYNHIPDNPKIKRRIKK